MTRWLLGPALGLFICMGCGAQQPVDEAARPPRSLTATPLLDNDGLPAPPLPWAVPDQADQHTRAGLYATETQARAHEQALPNGVIRVFAPCCGEPGLNEAMSSAWEQYLRLGTPTDMPVLVRGSDAQQATRLANRLTEAGFSPVFVVTAP